MTEGGGGGGCEESAVEYPKLIHCRNCCATSPVADELSLSTATKSQAIQSKEGGGGLKGT